MSEDILASLKQAQDEARLEREIERLKVALANKASRLEQAEASVELWKSRWQALREIAEDLNQ